MGEMTALHGVNLTGWLVLEPWVTPELFANTGSLDEQGLVNGLGEDNYVDLVSKHRSSFITEEDFMQIAARGLNAVRIPVPWYVFGPDGPNPGPRLGCLSRLDDALSWAQNAGLKVIISLAINPGSFGEEELLTAGNGGRKEDFLLVLAALAERYASWPAFFGIEVANEPLPEKRSLITVTPGVPLHVLRNYYRDAYTAIRTAAGSKPVIIFPDAGLPGSWRNFMAQKRYQHIWLDCHLYHYTDTTGTTGPAGTRELVERSRRALHEAQTSRLPIMIGTWSGALPFADSAMTPEGRIALERVYVSDQIALFGDRSWFFQTWKTSGHLPGWDSRTSLSSFERGMFDK